MPGPGPDQPGQALPGGTPHAVRGFPVTALSQTRLNLQVNSSLGQPAWFATVPWTGTSRSRGGTDPPDVQLCRQISRKSMPFCMKLHSVHSSTPIFRFSGNSVFCSISTRVVVAKKQFRWICAYALPATTWPTLSAHQALYSISLLTSFYFCPT